MKHYLQVPRLLFVFSIILFSKSVFAQVTWPAITKQTKPWSRWWWEGSAVNQKDLTTLLQQYKAAGLGGMEITPIYGVRGYEDQFINYLSPKWVSMLSHTLQEGKRLDLGIDLANATGWPFGGPWVTEEDACKEMFFKTFELKTGESLSEAVVYKQEPLVRAEGRNKVDISQIKQPISANKNLQELALDQVRFEKMLPLQVLKAYSDNGQTINLTKEVDASGKLNWKAPAGNWKLYAIFQGWHGKMVERAAPGGEGNVIDHFSKTALNNYLAQFDKAFKGQNVNSIRAFFNDSYEVDDARGQANFTPLLFEEFKKRRGYDLRDELPALLSKENSDKSNRVICDFRTTISELLLENFTMPWHTWAKSKGALIRNQSHGSPANILDQYAAIDIPETEGNDVLRYKFATSAAHVTGKNLTSSESATWLNEHFLSSLGDVKTALDRYLIGGVNHVFYHGIAYSPPSAPWPGWLFYAAVHFTTANPQWNEFSALNEYIARCQSFLQSGKPDQDILQYYPIFDSFSTPGRDLLKHYDGMTEFRGSDFEANAQQMLQRGYSFDFISDRQIQNLQVENQQIKTGGLAYKTILLSAAHYIPLETMQKILDMAKSGATVVIYKNLPANVPGYGNLQQRENQLKELLLQLKFIQTENSSVKKASLGKGSFLMGDDLDQLLAYAKINRETLADHLQFTRRQYQNGKYYFIVNKGNQKAEGWFPLETQAAAIALFDPMFKKSGLAKIRKTKNGNAEVFLQLLPGESCILQTSVKAINGNKYAYWKPSGEAQPIKGTWTLSFTEGGPKLPAKAQLSNLGSWTDINGDDYKNFSGTGKYSITFPKPQTKAAAWQLDLGKVHESAKVFLNGKLIATVIGPNYQVIIPTAEMKATNLLEVSVSNLMANRIADMDRRKVNWKRFYNTNFPARLSVNANQEGIFDASKWLPKPSGLLGPVTLTPIIYTP